ncbi:hypothetical protein EV182_002299 [Spiromyces aspiralis]|uniref:Uncharacterized protein n=1 Tax=Spiromyces aspiralis TaxID=68401 RepID=A0ACC1HHT2_9FUNG|nr:hypothetical protein EV182_002299 [Spiromyces aspiralis]
MYASVAVRRLTFGVPPRPLASAVARRPVPWPPTRRCSGEPPPSGKFGMGPAPFRLGDPKEQAEMEETIRKRTAAAATRVAEPHGTMSPEELEQFYERPSGALDVVDSGSSSNPLPPFPGNKNPETGEVGGPRGPEPTRYGDWERKGRVVDF